MLYHVLALTDWLAAPDLSYAPASLAADGFVHCSPDEATTLAVADAFYRATPGRLMALVIDEERLGAEVTWEAADPAPPPGVPAGTLFPHVYGRIERAAVVDVVEVEREPDGRPVRLVPGGGAAGTEPDLT